MTLSCIAAMSENRVIGVDGKLPWRLPSDLKWFKRTTMGRPLVMGRKTWESIGGKPLPGRDHVILTRRARYAVPEGVRVAGSLDAALDLLRGAEEVFVAGGGVVFAEAVPRADRIYLTVVHANLPGDTWFPELDPTLWKVVREDPRPADDRNAYAHTFRVYERAPLAP